MTAPGFDPEIYEEALGVILDHPDNFGSEALLALAAVCGGPMLRAAVDSSSMPPCPASGECALCWVNKYCIHKHLSKEDRLAWIDLHNQWKGRLSQ